MICAVLCALLSVHHPALPVEIGQCVGQHRVTCVVDGDTIWWHGEKLRLVGIDTPESHSPRCVRQSPLAGAATARLVELLQDGTPTIAREGADRYGRTLARLSVNGIDLGGVLLAEGLARVYVPGERPWCG